MHFDATSILVQAVNYPVENLVRDWLEGDGIKPDAEDHLAGCVLHDSLQLIDVVEVVLPNADDVPELLSALANVELVDSMNNS